MSVYDQLYDFQYFNQHAVLNSITQQKSTDCTVLCQNGSAASSPENHPVKCHHSTVRISPALHTTYMKVFY